MPPMARQPQQSPSPEEDFTVRLPTIFGIRPGVYLVALYGLAALILLFIVFFLPGIRNPGSSVTFDSSPRGSAVLVDGAYVGATPVSTFVKAGSHKVIIRAPGFNATEKDISVGSRVLGSLFFPLKQDESFSLQAQSPSAPIEAAIPRFAAWAQTGKPGTVFQIPMDLSEAAARGSVATSGMRDRLDLIEGAARWSADSSLLRDLTRALFVTESANAPLTPINFARGAHEVLDYLNTHEGAAEWLSSLSDLESAKTIADSPWRASRLAEAKSSASQIENTPKRLAKQDAMTIAGVSFIRIPAGRVSVFPDFPSPLRVDEFWIASREIDVATWNKFIAEDPEWAASASQRRKDEGFVDAQYLQAPPESSPVKTLQSNVSWYAADAFCQWFTQKVASKYPGSRVSLPTEAQWRMAADAAPSDLMTGDLWNWCSDAWAPYPYLPTTDILERLVTERVVRGASWANPSGSVSIDTRGSLASNTCSPFVGLRPVLLLK